MAPSNSSSPKTNQKLEAVAVAMEEKRTMNDPKQGSPQEAVLESTITEAASERDQMNEKISNGLRVLQAATNIMKSYPARDNIPLLCDICERTFCTLTALRRHQNIHKADREVERILKKREPSYFPGEGFWRKPYDSYQGTSNWADVGGYSQNAFSNHKDLGISRDPSESIRGDGKSIRSITFPPFKSGLTRENTGIDMAVGYPVPPYGNTPYGNASHGFASGIPLVTHNNNHLNLVSKRDNDNSNLSLSDFHRRGLSFGPFQSRGGGSSSDYPSFYNGGMTMADPATPYRYFTRNTCYASPSRDPVSLDLSLRPSNDIRSCTNNNSNSSTEGVLSLEVLLSPSKYTGGSNSNSSVNQSFNGGISGGELPDLNLPVRPCVSRYHFYSHNPLASITGNVPLSHPPTTNPPNDDENVSGSDRKGKKPKW